MYKADIFKASISLTDKRAQSVACTIFYWQYRIALSDKNMSDKVDENLTCQKFFG